MNDANCTFESVLVIVAAITEHKGTVCVGAVITIARAKLCAREARGQAVTDSALRAVLVSAIEMCEISNLFGGCVFLEHDWFECVAYQLPSIPIRLPKDWPCFMAVNPYRHLVIDASHVLLKGVVCWWEERCSLVTFACIVVA